MCIRNIQGMVLDVDGVLTDGRLYFAEAGEVTKAFHVHDGTAIKNWQRRGRKIAFLSGRSSPIVAARARDLGVVDVVQGREDKLEPFLELVKAWSLTPEQVCYVGDDTADLPPMRASGFAVAVANAASDVKAIADHVTLACGGAGAVREIVDYLLSDSETK